MQRCCLLAAVLNTIARVPLCAHADSFVVRYITIRNKFTSEILSELGGLWAAAVALIALAWSKSGHLNKKGGSEMCACTTVKLSVFGLPCRLQRACVP